MITFSCLYSPLQNSSLLPFLPVFSILMKDLTWCISGCVKLARGKVTTTDGEEKRWFRITLYMFFRGIDLTVQTKLKPVLNQPKKFGNLRVQEEERKSENIELILGPFSTQIFLRLLWRSKIQKIHILLSNICNAQKQQQKFNMFTEWSLATFGFHTVVFLIILLTISLLH